MLGVMSGTSLDGIDLAEIFFRYSEEGRWGYEIGVAETIPYPSDWKVRCRKPFLFPKEDCKPSMMSYTQYFGRGDQLHL